MRRETILPAKWRKIEMIKIAPIMLITTMVLFTIQILTFTVSYDEFTKITNDMNRIIQDLKAKKLL